MAVSPEAIFLSTFVLISQNRQDEARSMLANAEWKPPLQGQQEENDLEIEHNRELLNLSHRIYELTTEIRRLAAR